MGTGVGEEGGGAAVASKPMPSDNVGSIASTPATVLLVFVLGVALLRVLGLLCVKVCLLAPAAWLLPIQGMQS